MLKLNARFLFQVRHKSASSAKMRDGHPTVPIMNYLKFAKNIPVLLILFLGCAALASAQAPTITTQPANQTVQVGQSATFTVAVSNGPCRSIWYINGTGYYGSFDSTISYTIPSATLAMNGWTVTVNLFDCGSAGANLGNSQTARLTVSQATVAPAITAQPANQTVTVGQSATFTVAAGGTAPLSYQWQKNGANISGATAATYTTPATTSADTGSTFKVVVSNSAGSVASNAATVTVNPTSGAPAITQQPQSQTVQVGQSATFTVVVSNGSCSSFWSINGAGHYGSVGSTISYTIPSTTLAMNGWTVTVNLYDCGSTGANLGNSQTALLTVNQATGTPGIQVSSSSLGFGNDPIGTNLSQTFTITNTGSAPLSISQLTASGSTAFTVSGFSLPLSVGAGQKTTVTANFLPASVGAVSGTISIASNASNSPTVALSGSGIAATYTLAVSPTSLGFGNVTTGTSSAMQTVAISNTGNSKVGISQINVSAGYTVTGGSTPVTVSPSQTLTLNAQFSPTVAGSATGTISIVSNASGSPEAVSLSGAGVTSVQHSVALAWNASTSSVSGYNVYRSTVSGGSYTKINSSLVAVLDYSDANVLGGSTYYYVMTAVDAAGNESVYSNQASASIP